MEHFSQFSSGWIFYTHANSMRGCCGWGERPLARLLFDFRPLIFIIPSSCLILHSNCRMVVAITMLGE